MARVIDLIRFFRVVPPTPPLMTAAFVGTTLAATLIVFIDAHRAQAALTPLLMLQLFASSSGFAVPARRGHYDLLLSTGHSRVRIACAHWLMSVLPGIASWVALAAAEIVATRGLRAAMFASGTVAAVALVSTIPWAATVALPRFAGAIGWLLALALFSLVVSPALHPRLFTELGGGGFWFDSALALVLYPPLLVGERIAGAHGFLLLPALFLTLASMAYALVWIDGHDIPLEAAQ